MGDFWRMLVGPTPGECVNSALGNWADGEQTPIHGEPSETATKLAKAIEASEGRWAFEDDQGHAHCYGLGITVSHGPKAIVWQGARDEHVSRYYSDQTLLFEAAARTPDAIVILGALKKRRARYEQDVAAAARRADDERKAAQIKRANAAIDKLSRGECLDDPLRLNQCAGAVVGGLGSHQARQERLLQNYMIELAAQR